jgi:FkbM family methyltransferase
MNLIQNNLNINKLHNVEIHNYAVSDSKGFVKIPKNDNPNPSLVINSSLSDTHIEVESMLIDDFLSKNNIHPDFIKMDIEGAEGKALEGMKNTLAHENATLLVEIHVDVLKNNFDTDYKEIIKQLIKYGYTLTEIEHRKSDGKNRSIDPETELEGNTMILCKKINKKNLSSIET